MARVEKETVTKEVLYFTEEDFENALIKVTKSFLDEDEMMNEDMVLITAVGAAIMSVMKASARGDE